MQTIAAIHRNGSNLADAGAEATVRIPDAPSLEVMGRTIDRSVSPYQYPGPPTGKTVVTVSHRPRHSAAPEAMAASAGCPRRGRRLQSLLATSDRRPAHCHQSCIQGFGLDRERTAVRRLSSNLSKLDEL